MANSTRNRIGLLAALCVVLLAIGYLYALPAIPNERSIRSAIIQHLTEWTGATVSLTGAMRISYFPRPSVILSNVRIMGIQRLPGLREVSAKRIIVELGLWPLISGTAVVDRITLIEPLIKSIPYARAEVQRSPSKMSQYLVRALKASLFEQIAIENGTLSGAGPASEKFSDINVKINLSRSSGAHSSQGSFTWRGQNVSFRYEGGDLEQTANTVKIPVSVTISGDLFSAEIEGVAWVTDDLWLKGDLDLQIANLPGFARWTGVLVPDDQTSGDFAATGKFNWRGHRLWFDEASFVLDGNRALGAMLLDFGGPRPQIEGTFALQKLNLTRYIQTRAATPAPNVRPDRQKSAALDFPLLHHLDLDVRISTTELIAPPFTLGQSALSVTLKSGRLAADIAVFDMCGGSGVARLEFDVSVQDSTIRVTAKLTGVSARSCIEIFTPDSPIEGTANVTAEMAGRGRTAKDILATLDGKITVSMTEGKAYVDVARLVTSLRKGPVTGWSAARGGATAFAALNGALSLRPGSATLDSLKIDLGTAELTGEGNIDLAARGLDMRMRIIAHPPKDASADTKTSKPDDSLAGDIVIKGSWSEPRFTLEPNNKSTHLIAPEWSQTSQKSDFQRTISPPLGLQSVNLYASRFTNLARVNRTGGPVKGTECGQPRLSGARHDLSPCFNDAQDITGFAAGGRRPVEPRYYCGAFT